MNTTELKARRYSTLSIPRIAVLTLILLGGADRAQAQWATNGNNINNTNSGNVGIGTTNPGRPLVVTADASGIPLRVHRNANIVGWGTGIDWAFNNSSGSVTDYAYVNSTIVNNTAGSENGTLGFFTVKSGTLTQQAIIDQNGNVGIGTTSPGSKLHLYNNSGTRTGLLMLGQNIANVGEAGALFEVNTSGSGTLYMGAYKPGTGYGITAIQPEGGNVGIGTTGPQSVFQVQGTDLSNFTSTSAGLSTIRGTTLNNWSGLDFRSTAAGSGGIVQARIAAQATNNGTNLAFGTSNNYGTGITNTAMFIDYGGNVGIGTASPGARLDLGAGNLRVQSGTLDLNSQLRDDSINLYGGQYTMGIRPYTLYAKSTQAFRFESALGNGSLNAYEVGSTAGATFLAVKNDGNVGIGTTNPQTKLDVNGTVNATGLTVNGSPVTSSQWSTIGGNTINYAAGNVGIGVSSPSVKLDIGGQLHFGGACGGGVPNGQGGYLSWNQLNCGTGEVDFINHQGGGAGGFWFANTANGSSLSSLMFISGDGKVGIGTTSPGNKLAVNGSAVFGGSAGSSAEPIEVQGGYSGVALKDRNGTSPRWVLYPTGGVFNIFNDELGNALSISAAGNVGIGTGPSNNKLEVAGNINVAGTGNITAAGTIEGGNIKARYQDVAEWVESSQSLPAGTVVVLDHTKSNQVIASSEAYDTRVAGVISTRPGIALGEEGEAKVLVATTGRVKVKVDATAAPIQIGDLLVTSDKEGVAMKSLPVNLGGVQLHRPGTLIGKALEPLAKGQGEILVLLSLQ